MTLSGPFYPFGRAEGGGAGEQPAKVIHRVLRGANRRPADYHAPGGGIVHLGGQAKARLPGRERAATAAQGGPGHRARSARSRPR